MERSFSQITMVSGFGRSTSSAYTYALRQPSWVVKIALIAAILMLLVILLVVIVPVALIGGVALVALAGVAKVKSWLVGGRRGLGDGRRNVRVIVRDEPR